MCAYGVQVSARKHVIIPLVFALDTRAVQDLPSEKEGKRKGFNASERFTGFHLVISLLFFFLFFFFLSLSSEYP